MKEQIHGGDVYRHPEALDFSSNINPLGTPKSVIGAAADSLNQLANYPDVQYTKLKDALSKYENQPRENIICGNGAADLIFSLVLSLMPRRAVIPAPTFAEYEQALESVSCEVLRYEMPDFKVDRGILSLLTGDVDMLFLCNPNNPTGFLIPSELLKKILDRCKENNIVLMLDECFLDFVDEGEEHSFKKYLSTYSNLFILKAFTKRYAMAGIRLGYGLCGNPDILDKMNRVTQPWNVSIPAQAAGTAALSEREYEERSRLLIQRERQYLKEELSKLPIQVFDSQANYIFLKGPGNLYEKCLDRNILIRDCSNYPGLTKGYYRIAVKDQGDNEQLVQTFKDILN